MEEVNAKWLVYEMNGWKPFHQFPCKCIIMTTNTTSMNQRMKCIECKKHQAASKYKSQNPYYIFE